ncbi:108_t:CDS:2 [Diversispora eburnea]|uniref:108_t:CDS:1 n=1 Tax=Diversispora eburnea TaxID=1213867 RepID=A0A9N9G8F5_9GLOM|nr:108_t:CDS:2 [Diversispora eburnea]
MNYRENGNKAFVNGDFETARQEYTKGIEVASEDPRLWSNRAQTFIKLGYPELAIADAINALSLIEPKIISGKYEDADLVLFCKSGWRKAEALAKSDEYGSAAIELERVFQICNRRPVAGVDWNAWEREKDQYSKKHYQDITLLKNMGTDRHILVEQVGKIYKFPNRGAYPWDIRSQERCSKESLASVQKLLEKIPGKSIKVALVSFPDVSQEYEFGIIATKDIKKGTILLDEKPLISVHSPRQRNVLFATNQSVQKTWELYHRAICGKDLNSQYEIVNKDSKSSGSSLLIVLKIFAIAKQRDICPLDIEEIKHLFPFRHSTAKIKPNCNLFNPATETGQLYPIISLFNHHCDPNASLRDDISRAIRRGHDLSISSVVGNTVKTSGSTKRTRQILETTYGFRCRCSVCESSSN